MFTAMVLGCIVSDQNLPCREDCQCPEGQVCRSQVCKAGTPERPADGTLGGLCGGGGACGPDLVCVTTICEEQVCRATCVPGLGSGQCGADEICESLSDGGVTYGVCVP